MNVFFMDYSQMNYKGILSEVWEKWTWNCNAEIGDKFCRLYM
jgi:hypothetical protein